MLFNSSPFLLFFIVVSTLYFLIPGKFRWVLLLAASCFFYMFFKPIYILILGFTIVVDYYAGTLLENEPDKKRRKKYLVMSLIANIGILAFFKYYNFLNTNVSGLALLFGYKNPVPYLNILLPIGLSFHTFQAMSYTIEVYRGNQKAERHFGIYALYVMFYPQLVAGPIERPQNLLHQFHEKKQFDYNNAVSGLRLIVWGLFKKSVIADRLALVTDPVFNSPHNFSAFSILVATIFFSFQIYCDFSGYSDIAIGTARFMGFKLMNNFNRPYFSKSISEFWTRWHISLSTWFRDYLYIPLGGNKVSKERWCFNIFLVFMLSGLWHGANWTFIIWGLLHGFFMISGTLTAHIRHKIRSFTGIVRIKWLDNTIQRLVTFSLVTTAWIFFRAKTVQDAFYMIRKLPNSFSELAGIVKHHLPLSLPITEAKLWVCVLVILIMEFIQIKQKNDTIDSLLQARPRYIRWCIYYFFVLTIIYLGVFNNRQFIYFQF